MMAFATDKLDPHKGEPPPVAVSEAKMAEDAQDAISFLERNNLTDLYEALGLTNYVKVVEND